MIIKKRRKGKAAKKKEEKRKVPSNFLKRIWKDFLRNIPKEFRRSITLYKQFIVFGESGSGKSELINTYTDWKGQAQQFYPSYTIDSNLQIYLSSSAIVQEIPTWILRDTSKEIRVALKKLWKPLAKKEPEVVATVNVLDLVEGFSDHLKNYAQTLRGKINVISEIARKPIKVRIVLTYMDHIEGYSELVEFLAQNGFCLRISGDSLDKLIQSLRKYEDLLPHILTSCSASSYMKIISFIKKMEVLLSILSEFIKTIKLKDPLSITPICEDVYLTSIKHTNIMTTNPFIYDDYKISSFQDKLPLVKHKVAALAIGILLSFGLIGLFAYESYNLKEITTVLKDIENKHHPDKDLFLHKILEKINKDNESFISTTFPIYFSYLREAIKHRCLRDLNDIYIYPNLYNIFQNYQNVKTNQSAAKVIYSLAFLYAKKDNQLGRLILSNMDKFSSILDLKPQTIKDYIYYNLYLLNKNKFKDIPIVVYDINKDLKLDNNKLLMFFEILNFYISKPNRFVSISELASMKKEAYYLCNVLKRVKNYKLLFDIYDNIRSKNNVIIIGKEILKLKRKPLEEILLTILQTEINIDEGITKYSLSDFVEYLKVIEQTVFKDSVEKSWHFKIKNKKFYFSTKKWNDVIKSSILIFALKKYIRENEFSSDLIFFKDPSSFDDISLNSTNDGNFLFVGKARIKGIYTKKAFELVIRPLLNKIAIFINKLPIPESEKNNFLNFIYSKVDIYAKNYANEYLSYLDNFSIRARSLGELKLVLANLQQPHSPLLDLLLVVKKNTNLNFNEKNPLASPFIRYLYQFEWVWRLLKEEKGIYPEYGKYKIILAQMFYEIENYIPVKPKNPEKFEDLLSPIGRICFDIYLNKKDSFLNLVKTWLESVNIPVKWHSFFLAPVYEAYNIGLKEVELHINSIWKDLCERDVYPILRLFPFNKETKDMATVEDLKKITDPKGHFWMNFDRFLKYFVNKNSEGLWEVRNSSKGLKIPSNMIATLNFFATLSKKLWTKEGNPIPLIVYIKPFPLPRIIDSSYIAVLSYIKVGKDAVWGFNQRPTWQKLKFVWWEKQNATVGVKIVAKNKPIKIKEINYTDTLWSLYVLLMSSTQTFYKNQNVLYTWKFNWEDIKSSRNNMSRAILIKFLFKEHPWKIFQVPISLYH